MGQADQRGYGMSDEPTGPFSYYEDIRAVLDYCGVFSAHIVASSFGGAAAIDFTLQYPDRVNKLILVGPSVHGASYPFRLTWEGLMDYLRVRRLGIEAAGEIFMNKKFLALLGAARGKPEAAVQAALHRQRRILPQQALPAPAASPACDSPPGTDSHPDAHYRARARSAVQ